MGELPWCDERLVQIGDEVVRVWYIFPFLLYGSTAECQCLSPKLFAAATLALYAAFVMLVLGLIVPEVVGYAYC
ncbi:hypothetical protein TSUD_143920 [Trifolium subterraneum]|uniref:Uncharacterized protein n=1 Tax=Trifolium subterraneum TaxID=3900 RepID=A0A2Z6ME25_TRISU|nr:hypothetical protein TSUD_143920 [Trifolium subterraneum]